MKKRRKRNQVNIMVKKLNKQELLKEIEKYSQLLGEHYSTLEKQKSENGEISPLLLKCIEGTKKIIRISVNKLVSLKEGEEWRDCMIAELEKDDKIWEAVQGSYQITDFRKLVGMEKFNEILQSK